MADVKIAIVGDATKFVESMGVAEGAAGSFGSKMGQLGQALQHPAEIAVVVAATIGATLIDIGEKFETSFNKIRAVTGANEEQMKGLEQSFKDVFASGPDSMAKVTDALSLVSVRTKLTGQDLDALTETELKLARITGGDVKEQVDATTKAFGNWAIEGVGPSKLALDGLLEVSQQTGISVVDLATAVSGKGGAAFRGFGIDMQGAAAILGSLNAAGVDSQPIVMGLTKALIDAQKTGKDAKTELGGLFQTLKDGKDGTKEMGEAIKVFGARGFETLRDAVHSGKLSLEEFTGTAQVVPGEIDRIAEANLTLGDRFEMLKNKATTALEPIASGLLKGLVDGMDAVTSAFNEGGFSKVFQMIGANIQAVWPQVQTALTDAGKKVVAWIQLEGPVIAAQLVAWGKAFVEWVGPKIPPMLEELGKLLGAAGTWLIDVALPVIEKKLIEWANAFAAWIGPAILPMLAELGKLYLEFEKWVLTEALPKIIVALKDWAVALYSWIFGDAIPGLIKALPGVLSTIADYLNDVVGPAIIAAVGHFVEAVLSWVGDAINAAPGKLAYLAGVILGELGKLPQEIVDALSGLAGMLFDKAVEWGKSIVDGIRSQISSIPGMIAGALGVGDTGWTNQYTNPKPHAGGGILDPGWNLVGEQGPELVNSGSGQVLTAGQTAAAMHGGVTININRDVYGVDDIRRAVADGLAMAV